jgi:catechol 2,3-dioxygenase-like lactoylglutathione lyase family enzyme
VIKVSRVESVCIPVADQDAALAFYTDVLGFALRTDTPFGPGLRWIEVGPDAEDSTTIALAPAPEGGPTGGRQTGIIVLVDDIDASHAQLKAAGTDVDDTVERMGDPVPPLFWFRDPEGNTIQAAQ